MLRIGGLWEEKREKRKEREGEREGNRRKKRKCSKDLLTLNDYFSLPQRRILSLRKRYLKQTFKEYQHSKEV